MRFADRYKAGCLPQCIPADCWPPECPPPDYHPPPVVSIDRSPVMPIPAYVPPPPPPPAITARPALYQIRPQWIDRPGSHQLRGLGALEMNETKSILWGAVLGAGVGLGAAYATKPRSKKARNKYAGAGMVIGALIGAFA